MNQKHWMRMIAPLVLLVGLELAAQLPVPAFENNSTEKTESGYIKLSWRLGDVPTGSNAVVFELQQSAQQDFTETKSVYRGPDYATFISGLPNGNYYHRVRTTTPDGTQHSNWSEPMLVQVQHHSLQLAFLLFGIGATVFLFTVGIVIQGVRKAAQNH